MYILVTMRNVSCVQHTNAMLKMNQVFVFCKELCFADQFTGLGSYTYGVQTVVWSHRCSGGW